MARDTEIIKAGSVAEAVEQIYALYPTLTDFQILSRRNERGQFSRFGHTFLIQIQFEAPEEEAPEELGEDEY